MRNRWSDLPIQGIYYILFFVRDYDQLLRDSAVLSRVHLRNLICKEVLWKRSIASRAYPERYLVVKEFWRSKLSQNSSSRALQHPSSGFLLAARSIILAGTLRFLLTVLTVAFRAYRSVDFPRGFLMHLSGSNFNLAPVCYNWLVSWSVSRKSLGDWCNEVPAIQKNNRDYK